MMMIMITILIRTKNRPQMLRRAIESVINQCCDVVVSVDPNATQETISVANQYPVTVVHSNVGGTGGMWNCGMEAVRAGWCKILDDDDILYGTAIDIMKRFIRDNPECRDCIVSFPADSDIGKARIIPTDFNHQSPLKRLDYILLHKIGVGSPMFHHTMKDTIGGVREDIMIHEDYDWALRTKGHVLYCNEVISCIYRTHGNNISGVIREGIRHKLANRRASFRVKCEVEVLRVGRIRLLMNLFIGYNKTALLLAAYRLKYIIRGARSEM